MARTWFRRSWLAVKKQFRAAALKPKKRRSDVTVFWSQQAARSGVKEDLGSSKEVLQEIFGDVGEQLARHGVSTYFATWSCIAFTEFIVGAG